MSRYVHSSQIQTIDKNFDFNTLEIGDLIIHEYKQYGKDIVKEFVFVSWEDSTTANTFFTWDDWDTWDETIKVFGDMFELGGEVMYVKGYLTEFDIGRGDLDLSIKEREELKKARDEKIANTNFSKTYKGKHEQIIWANYKGNSYTLIVHKTTGKGSALISFEETPYSREWFLPKTYSNMLAGKLTKGNVEKLQDALETVDVDTSKDYFQFEFTLETERARGYEFRKRITVYDEDMEDFDKWVDVTQWVPKSVIRDGDKVPAWFLLKMDVDEHTYEDLVKMKLGGYAHRIEGK